MSTSTPASESGLGAFLVQQFDLAFRMINALAADFDDEQARTAPPGHKPLVWYLGHVTVTLNRFLMLHAGAESALSEEFLGRFGRGSDGSADFSDAPSKDDLLAQYAALHGQGRTFVAGLLVDDFDRETSSEVPHPMFKLLGTALSVVEMHDAYHAGQIAALRRAMGKDPLFG